MYKIVHCLNIITSMVFLGLPCRVGCVPLGRGGESGFQNLKAISKNLRWEWGFSSSQPIETNPSFFHRNKPPSIT